MAYYDAQGKQTQKSSKTTDAKLAKKMADTLEEVSRKARQGQLTRARLNSLLEGTLAGLGIESNESSLQEYFKSWLAGKHGTASDSTLRRYAANLEEFSTFLGDRANLPRLRQEKSVKVGGNFLKTRIF